MCAYKTAQCTSTQFCKALSAVNTTTKKLIHNAAMCHNLISDSLVTTSAPQRTS